ncbi:MAG: CopG family ribbon-helix-helix protein [Bacillota bacterium]|jgi:CopG family transcriptional regulator/antitoxin EndoAI
MISLPDTLLAEVDGIVALENRNRSELIREAMNMYLQEVKRRRIREELINGYVEMARTNLALAEEALHAENEVERYWPREQAVGGRSK